MLSTSFNFLNEQISQEHGTSLQERCTRKKPVIQLCCVAMAGLIEKELDIMTMTMIIKTLFT